MVKLAVYDNRPTRRGAMKLAFKESEIIEYYDGCDFAIGSFDVVFQHYSEMRNEKATKLRKSAKLVVYYGGNGEPDPRWEDRPDPKDSDLRIWRPVHQNGNGALSSEEGKALVGFARSRPFDATKKPEFLKPPESPHVLTALSILCQGFLMVSTEKSADFQTVMKLMGVQQSTQIKEEERKKTIYKKAFSNVFGDKKAKTIIKNAKIEWKRLSSKSERNEVKFKAVESFIMAATSGNPQMDTTVINNAYMALNERLGAASGK